MIYGCEPTKSLTDMSRAPAESQPAAAAIALDPRNDGAEGRKRLRRLLGAEHEKSDRDIPGLRGFPVWRFVLRAGAVEAAPAGSDVVGLPTVYLLGPTARKFMTIGATADTSGADAAVILAHVASLLAKG